MPAVATPASSPTWTTSHLPTRSAMPSHPPHPPPPPAPTYPPLRHHLTHLDGLVGEQSVPELRIITVRVEQRVPPIHLHHPAQQDAALQPPVVRTGVRASRPSTSPLQEPPKQRAHSRADTSFSRQIRLRQIRH